MIWLALIVGLVWMLIIQFAIGMGMRELRKHHAERNARSILDGAFGHLATDGAVGKMTSFILAGKVTAESLTLKLEEIRQDILREYGS